jgi:hypothetical protein
MTKSAQYVAVIAIVLSTLSGRSFAESRTNTSTANANLHIQVNVIQVVMTTPDQNPKATPETAISYSIPTVQPRMSVTKEIRKMQASDGKNPGMVETTTIVAE